MAKELCFEGITLKAFDEQYRSAINDFDLNERQQIYSSLPKEVIDDAINDVDRIANVAINDKNEVVGFLYYIVTISMKVMIHLKMSFIFVHYRLMKISRFWIWHENNDVIAAICSRCIS